MGLAHETAAIIDVNRHARVAVGPIGMMGSAQLLEHRIDLDGIDVSSVVGQCRGNIVARPGADDQHVFERLAGRFVMDENASAYRKGPTDRLPPFPGARCCSHRSTSSAV